jgi:hypothetical protein
VRIFRSHVASATVKIAPENLSAMVRDEIPTKRENPEILHLRQRKLQKIIRTEKRKPRIHYRCFIIPKSGPYAMCAEYGSLPFEGCDHRSSISDCEGSQWHGPSISPGKVRRSRSLRDKHLNLRFSKTDLRGIVRVN